MAMKPRCREDVVLAMALVRPSAASDGRKAEFLEHWRRSRSTDGHLVYEDDGIRLLQGKLGCSESEAEALRKGFAKRDPGQMREVYERLSGDPDREEVVDDLSYYNLYSFCRAHALSYGWLVWALAYQKAHNRQRFWCAVLNNAASMYLPWVHVQEAKRAGLRVRWGKAPYVLEGSDLVPLGNQYLVEPDGWYQFGKAKFWTSDRFMPGMYCHRRGDSVTFRGLVGAARWYVKDGKGLTFVTVGWDTGRYLDIVLNGVVPIDRFDIVEGSGAISTTSQGCSVIADKYTLSEARADAG